MSWYTKRIVKGTEGLAETEPLIDSDLQSGLTMCFTVVDMLTQDDYEVIKKHLLELSGIVEVRPYFTPKKLCVTFNPLLTSLEHIVYTISLLGYHYINRG